MRVAIFDTHPYDREALLEANQTSRHDLTFFDCRLSYKTVSLAQGFEAVSVFVNDRVDRDVLYALQAGGTRLIALRCAGFNNIDLGTAEALGVAVVRVPAYSPYAVAEHATALLLCLNRKVHRAYARVREGNFELDGLVGYDLHGKTVGILGTGHIGRVMATIMHGYGCRALAFDKAPDLEWSSSLGVTYVSLEELLQQSDIVSLHVPLSAETTHLIDAAAIAQMKRGVVLINTSRGGIIDTGALIDALKHGQVGAAGLDVYERETGVFFENHSFEVLQDDQLARLLSFPNVLITGHQAFLTHEALAHIAETTLENLTAFESGKELVNTVTPVLARPPRI